MMIILLLLWVLATSQLVDADCVPNSELLKTKLELKRHDNLKPPTSGIELSLKLQQIEVQTGQSRVVVDGFLTKRYVDKDLDYSAELPCEEFAIVHIENITTLRPPTVRLMNGRLISDAKTRANAVVFPNGTVLETQRIAIEAPCVFNSSSPVGALDCRLIWQNLDYHQNEMFVIWSDDISKDTSALNGGIQSDGAYHLKNLEFTHNVIRKSVGDFDELVLTIKLEKSKIKELLMFYLPQLVFVAISWLSMFLGPMAITRSVLIIGSMLLLVLHQQFYLSTYLTSNNISLYDIWKIGTLLFTFFTLIELVLITCMASVGRSNRILSIFGKKDKAGKSYYSFEPLYEELNDLRNRKSRKTCTCCSYSALFLDLVSMVFFGAAFVLFCLLYFGAPQKVMDFVNNFQSHPNQLTNVGPEQTAFDVDGRF